VAHPAYCGQVELKAGDPKPNEGGKRSIALKEKNPAPKNLKRDF